MLHGLLMLQVNLPVVDTNYQLSNKYVMDVEIKVTDESKLNSPDYVNQSEEKPNHLQLTCCEHIFQHFASATCNSTCTSICFLF